MNLLTKDKFKFLMKEIETELCNYPDIICFFKQMYEALRDGEGIDIGENGIEYTFKQMSVGFKPIISEEFGAKISLTIKF